MAPWPRPGHCDGLIVLVSSPSVREDGRPVPCAPGELSSDALLEGPPNLDPAKALRQVGRSGERRRASDEGDGDLCAESPVVQVSAGGKLVMHLGRKIP